MAVYCGCCCAHAYVAAALVDQMQARIDSLEAQLTGEVSPI